ncbi:DMT family transporter [Brucella rhizosphaerae]|uniref:EamA-like transporter family protein n=1 Tax=Brucella rhizosphaerae TaxID=571254 RepID=A0A256FPK6_9HYPH|nr:DMT family transporter [Brucella rhizosphaerae]OYR16784.1 eamA-like transporter family protein [Brucella rhizosphaerae]
MPIYELAALGAAVCWALTGLISAGPAGHLGALTFNQVRQIFVSCLLIVYVIATGTWQQINSGNAFPLILSGFIGIFLGDTILFVTLNRLGPRRSGILFAMNAPIAAVLGWAVLGEKLTASIVIGIALTILGVCLAIFFSNRRTQTHPWETVKGSLLAGLLFGLLAALGQAIGSIIVRPVMQTGIDPFLASLLRVGTAACCLSLISMVPVAAFRPRNPLTRQVTAVTALSGFLALAMGMTLLLFALSGGETGVVSTISATTPVIILPLLWLRTGQRPAAGAWLGGIFVVAGLAFIMYQ